MIPWGSTFWIIWRASIKLWVMVAWYELHTGKENKKILLCTPNPDIGSAPLGLRSLYVNGDWREKTNKTLTKEAKSKQEWILEWIFAIGENYMNKKLEDRWIYCCWSGK